MTSFDYGNVRQIKDSGLYRRLIDQQRLGPTETILNGRRILMLAGNDYLGLASHPKVVEAAKCALQEHGASAGASRLISGNHRFYPELEQKLACFKDKEAALVFPTGYMTNLGVLSVIADRHTTIYMDKLNHASLYDGARLSGARLKRYRHNNPNHLDSLLAKDTGSVKKLIVTDGVFSMDGDLADLAALKELTGRYDCGLIVDDAHGTGVLGQNGRGTADHLNVNLEVEIGTLSKALGGIGGYVVGPTALAELLINTSRPFIYTTGLPPASLAGSAAALAVLERETWRQKRVLAAAARVRANMTEAGFTIPAGITPIIPIIVGDRKTAMALAEAVLAKGVFVPAIRYPTVPKNQARLRLTISAIHTDEELNKAMDIIVSSSKELKII